MAQLDKVTMAVSTVIKIQIMAQVVAVEQEQSAVPELQLQGVMAG
jgi:hypothetical protein